MIGKKSTNKFASADIGRILPPEIFSSILRRAGRDTSGNYKYEYFKNF